MRGEDALKSRTVSGEMGSPPHARGRRERPVNAGVHARITPACAGKTSHSVPISRGSRDHPRMRGEDQYAGVPANRRPGSPPHARGRLRACGRRRRSRRITPACAGKTFRVLVEGQPPPGSPPHARGRLIPSRLYKRKRRITPACAGKTLLPVVVSGGLKDHPRMRGEDCRSRRRRTTHRGSPPHARGRRRCRIRRRRRSRITPACAGKTAGFVGGIRLEQDHPRMRGEDLVNGHGCTFLLGSPPHARGRRRIPPKDDAFSRITPACAGKTGQ